MASLNTIVKDQGEEDRIPRKVDISERVASVIINQREALLNKLGMGNHSSSQPRQSPPECRQDAPPRQIQSAPVPSRVPVLIVKKDLCAMPGCHGVRLKNTDLCRACKDRKGSTERPRDTPVMRSEPQRQSHAPYQEPPRKCKIRKCNQPAAPNFNYCLECLEDVDPQYQMSSGSSLPMATPPVEHLEQQLRGLYVGPDKSDSSPTYRTPPEEFPYLNLKRSKCQRPGGCPDDMFGDPAKKNLCSKCWKAVGEVMPATQRAPGAHQGKYDTTYAGRA